MPDESETDSEAEPSDTAEAEPLSGWSRFGAGVAGLTLSGSGTLAVFKTDNQAGAVALVLGGIIFLLILMSGNPLLSLGHGDTQVKFATKRRRQAIEEVVGAPPQEAQRALDVIQTVDPGAARDSNFIRTSREVYERLLISEISKMFPDFTLEQLHRDYSADLRISSTDGKSASIDVKYFHGKNAIMSSDVSRLVGAATLRTEGILLVSNKRMNRTAAEIMSTARGQNVKVEYSNWRDEQDNRNLFDALSALLNA